VIDSETAMALKLGQAIILSLLLSGDVRATPNIVQSLVVNFPINGRVIVQAREEVGKFPQMLFISEKTGKVLLQNSIEDEDKWLIPEKNEVAPPNLRFRVVRSSGFHSTMVMSVGLYRGGSDNASFLTVFGEFDGKILRLNAKPLFANIQGGYYLGHLNRRLGYGLAVWNFIWGGGINESHYSEHKYEIEIYRLQGNKLKRMLRRVSRRMYAPNEGAKSLREIGVGATDQRRGIPIIKDSLK
jgi:hypothetical protein